MPSVTDSKDMIGGKIWKTRSSITAEGPRDALSVEILSTAVQLYEKKSHL